MTHRPDQVDALLRARALMERHPVIDGLALGAPTDRFLADCRAGLVSAVNWTLGSGHDTPKAAFMKILAVHRLQRRASEHCLVVRGIADIDVARREGRLGIIVGWQGAGPLSDDLDWLEVFWGQGLRIAQLCYNDENRLGFGCLEPNDGGLKRFGIEVVRECDRIGVLIDLSHTGQRTSREAIEASARPCVFSHSNPSAVQANPRNITDDLIRACAARGGVIGISALTALLTGEGAGRRASLEEWVRCVDHVVDLVGVDHVAIGTDVGAAPGNAQHWNDTMKRRFPEVVGGVTFETRSVAGVDSHADFPQLIAALLARGYAEPDVVRIMGGNWRRVLAEVWRT